MSSRVQQIRGRTTCSWYSMRSGHARKATPLPPHRIEERTGFRSYDAHGSKVVLTLEGLDSLLGQRAEVAGHACGVGTELPENALERCDLRPRPSFS